MILLDTNVVSELRRFAIGGADANVVAWAAAIEQRQQFISAVTLLEIRWGILRQKDPVQTATLQRWLDNQVRPRFAGHIVAVDDAVALACASLHVPVRRPELDALIAATALVHGLTLATRNVRDFAGTGVRLVNPWAYRVGTSSAPE